MQILVADDDVVSRHLVSGLLQGAGHTVISARNGDEALAVLEANDPPKIAILDWMMPEIDGIEVCRRVRAIPERHYTYMIALTAKHEDRDLVYALESGFDDFLSKPVHPRELKARLVVGRRIVELQEKLLLSCNVMKFHAAHDGLTGLWNRAGIVELLEAHVARSIRDNAPLAAMLVDIDHFKAVNDTYGHLAGDQVLKRVAQTMAFSVRGGDLLGRYGGEEFLILAPGCAPDTALPLAERLRTAMAHTPVVTSGISIAVTVSVGVAVGQGSSFNSFELLHEADAALYGAKQNGRNRVQVAAKFAKGTGRHAGIIGGTSEDESGAGPAPAGPQSPLQEGQVLWSAVQLQPFSAVAARALQLANRSDSPLGELAELISSDAAFSSEILTIVNSALYNFGKPTTSIERAIFLLGLERVKGLAVTVGVRTYLRSSVNNPTLGACWRHSLACALIAEEAATGYRLDSGTAYTGGIMHDIGRMALAVLHSERYVRLLAEASGSIEEVLQAERRLFGVDHCEAGCHLIREWNLPAEFVEITAGHHDPAPANSSAMVALIRWSCNMAGTLGFSATPLVARPEYELLVGALPEQARSHFGEHAKDLAAKIEAKVNALAFC